jgi:hypothetical protein
MYACTYMYIRRIYTYVYVYTHIYIYKYIYTSITSGRKIAFLSFRRSTAKDVLYNLGDKAANSFITDSLI